jgi:DNA repair ATPase RecN
VGVSIEDIDLLLADWGFLSRKHGVSAFLLPSCHRSLRLELDGNVEKSTLLPHAKQTEELNLIQYDDACKQLSKARTEVCENLSKDVSLRLPSLGMEDFLFISRVNSNVRNCSHTVLSSLGVDSIDFLLLNTKMLKDDELPSVWNVNDQYNQHLDVVGSSGEKARVLICLETTVPGSIGACIADLHPRVEIIDNNFAHPMVAILYDEIDAHVGGRALVALGKMLHEQTNYFERFGKRRKRRGQVICITHSASLAALADHHLVVHKVKESRAGLNDMIEVIVENVEGEQRTKELARMASGDVATNEAELLAEALIQNHWKEKNHQ